MIKLFKNIKEYIFGKKIELEVKKLPSMGLFYDDEFKIFIKKMEIEEIFLFKKEYDFNNIFKITESIRRVVEKHTIYSKGYNIDDLSSIDLMYVFYNIIALTKNKPINFIYQYNNILKNIPFTEATFRYAKLDKLLENYDPKTKTVNVGSYRLKYPTIGIEKSIYNFIIDMGKQNKIDDYKDYNYNFMYFVPDKKTLTYEEIDNLLILFNNELPDDLQKTITEALGIISDNMGYKLYSKEDDSVIDISSIDLKNILD